LDGNDKVKNNKNNPSKNTDIHGKLKEPEKSSRASPDSS